jgi:hypothetical protein
VTLVTLVTFFLPLRGEKSKKKNMWNSVKQTHESHQSHRQIKIAAGRICGGQGFAENLIGGDLDFLAAELDQPTLAAGLGECV